LNVRFISPANIELDEIVSFFDYQLPGLGHRFFLEVNAAIEKIKFMPTAWTTIGERTRRCILKGFPYALLYIERQKNGIEQSLIQSHQGRHYCS